MQTDFIKNSGDELSTLEWNLDEFVRNLFGLLSKDCPYSEKIAVIKQEYEKVDQKGFEKSEVLIKRLLMFKKEIDPSKQGMNKLLIEGLKLLCTTDILDRMTFQNLTREEFVKIDDDSHCLPNQGKSLDELERIFIFELIRRKQDVKKDKDEKVKNILEKLKEIDFNELDKDLEIKFEEYGSSQNGLFIQGSDYNVSLSSREAVHERKLLNFFYDKATDVLREYIGKDAFQITKITHDNIRVPVVQINIKKGNLNLSFTANNELGVINTNLIKTYIQFDSRCFALSLLVKIWAQTHRVVSWHKNYLTSYAFTLLVINFLQTLKNPLLPSLQALSQNIEEIRVCRQVNDQKIEEFVTRIDFERDPEVLKREQQAKYSSNELTEIKLLKKFFKFYSQRDKFQDIRFSVKSGKHLLKSKEGLERMYLYSIEDPFDTKNNPGAFLKEDSAQAEELLRIMDISYKLLKENKFKEIFQPLL